MALKNIKFANLRPHRFALGTKKGLNPSSQSTRSGQVVSPTGAARVVRPPLTAVRQMDDRGQGNVRYY